MKSRKGFERCSHVITTILEVSGGLKMFINVLSRIYPNALDLPWWCSMMLQYSHAFMPKSLPSSHSIGAVHGWCWKDRPELHVVIAAKTQVEELLKPNGVQQGF